MTSQPLTIRLILSIKCNLPSPVLPVSPCPPLSLRSRYSNTASSLPPNCLLDGGDCCSASLLSRSQVSSNHVQEPPTIDLPSQCHGPSYRDRDHRRAAQIHPQRDRHCPGVSRRSLSITDCPHWPFFSQQSLEMRIIFSSRTGGSTSDCGALHLQ